MRSGRSVRHADSSAGLHESRGQMPLMMLDWLDYILHSRYSRGKLADVRRYLVSIGYVSPTYVAMKYIKAIERAKSRFGPLRDRKSIILYDYCILFSFIGSLF